MSGEACSVCGDEENIQSHHISYEPEMTVPLCVDCHRKVHGHGVGKSNYESKSGYSIKEKKLAALLSYTSELNCRHVAEAFDVARGTISSWRNKHLSDDMFLLNEEQRKFIDENVEIGWDGFDIDYIDYSIEDKEVPV